MLTFVFVLLHIYYVTRNILYVFLWWKGSKLEYKIKNVESGELPKYTILAPMYREYRVVNQLINNLSKLDYPKDRLQIICLVEEDDDKVIAEVRNQQSQRTDMWIEMIICPPPKKGQTKTKPRALNFALDRIEGEYLVIYDAEDEPEIDQLKKAVYLFERTDYACLQACLNYRNHSENWIARMFSTEYTVWFDRLIPGLVYYDMAIPLGGTSNHFRTSVIKELGGWDPMNVTEDCEIGLRMFEKGMKVGWLNSTTWEEACHRFWPWVKQRTRWIKGYMYTWLNTPFKVKNIKALVSWHLFVLGTPLVALINPILWGISTYWLFGGDVSWAFSTPFAWKLALFCLLFGNISHILIAAKASADRGRYLNALLAITFPAYWLMMSIAGYRAAQQMITSPSTWEKTEHGVSSRDDRKEKV